MSEMEMEMKMEMDMEIEEVILVYILDFLGIPEAANDRQRLLGSQWLVGDRIFLINHYARAGM